MEKIDNLLSSDTVIGNLFVKIETATKIPRRYIFLIICGVFMIYLLFGSGASLLATFIGFAYPAYKSVFAIESEEKDDDTQWLTYWVVYGFFSIAEYFTDIFLSWFPFYYLLKCGFLVWCMMGGENNGSLIIYRNLIYPNVKKYSSRIDKVLEEAKDKLGEIANEGFTMASEAATGIATNLIQSGIKGEKIDSTSILAAASTQIADLKEKVLSNPADNTGVTIAETLTKEVTAEIDEAKKDI